MKTRNSRSEKERTNKVLFNANSEERKILGEEAGDEDVKELMRFPSGLLFQNYSNKDEILWDDSNKNSTIRGEDFDGASFLTSD
ncbi:hypothetical protein D5086_006398 [Populus alba]|uniref:Uncharacterized protein n=1 Tax=Populus alba TaxID=43335 RepID=A0ACC4CKV7_POPAL